MNLKLPGAYFRLFGLFMVSVDYTLNEKKKLGFFWPKPIFQLLVHFRQFLWHNHLDIAMCTTTGGGCGHVVSRMALVCKA